MNRGPVGRVRAAALTAAALLLCAACGAGSEETSDPGSPETPTSARTGTSSTPSGSSSASPGAALPEYAVDAPGPRKGALVSADVLIQDPESLPDDVVSAVSDLSGVQSSLRFSLAQVGLENKLYKIAAVNPATYRNFTPAVSDGLQDQWDRIAGGEVAVSDQLKKLLPVDKEGYIELTLDKVTTRVHVGAYAPQVSGVDLVVNERIGEALGMPVGNALLVSTGQRSPDSMKKPIEAAVGTEASVQNLDVVAQLGLDPDVFQNVVFVGPFSDAVGVFRYTPIGGGRVQPEPAWVSAHIATEVVPILGRVTCNKAMLPQLKAALQEVVTSGLADKIHPDEYAGCYYPRFIAGTTTLSNHSFGLALDINVPGNGRGTVGEIDRGVVAIFKRWGFAWGGDWNYTDPMHFEVERLVRPG